MFNPSRDQVREFFFNAWAKFQGGQTLTDLERIAAVHMTQHPEYHTVLNQPERYREQEWPPELGETNPFLHLSMHVSISEQLSIDQPPGVKARFDTLKTRLNTHDNPEHAAQHAVMDCLGEMLWRAQRDRLPPDAVAYLECLEKHP